MTPTTQKKCTYGCRHWKNMHWTDGNGIFRFGKCTNPKTHISVEEAEKNSYNPSYNAPCWETRT